MQEWLWRGGPRRWAVAAGFVGALWAAGALLAGLSGPVVIAAAVVSAVGGGLVGWVLCSALLMAVGWPGWRRGEPLSQLSPSDRVAVIRAVRRGEPADPRLAPSVLTLVRVEVSAAEQEKRQRWIFYVLPALMISVAAGWTAAGSARFAAYFWGLTVFCLVPAFLLPGRAERRLKNAGEAARIAGDQITGAGETSC